MFGNSSLEAKTANPTKSTHRSHVQKRLCTLQKTQKPRQESIYQIDDTSNKKTEDEDTALYTDVSDSKPTTDDSDF